MATAAKADRAAVGFSVACILHCTALPLAAVSLPALAAFAEAEWAHWLFTLLALSTSGLVVFFAQAWRTTSFIAPATLGSVFLALALIAEPLGFSETLPTVIGGLLLAGAHGYRLVKHK